MEGKHSCSMEVDSDFEISKVSDVFRISKVQTFRLKFNDGEKQQQQQQQQHQDATATKDRNKSKKSTTRSKAEALRRSIIYLVITFRCQYVIRVSVHY
jgi:hypothetical protein